MAGTSAERAQEFHPIPGNDPRLLEEFALLLRNGVSEVTMLPVTARTSPCWQVFAPVCRHILPIVAVRRITLYVYDAQLILFFSGRLKLPIHAKARGARYAGRRVQRESARALSDGRTQRRVGRLDSTDGKWPRLRPHELLAIIG